MIEEHPDSINDGFFDIGTPILPSAKATKWESDLPASFHNGGVAITFADSHAETHHWRGKSTLAKVAYSSANMQPSIPSTPASEQVDFHWISDHSSIKN